MIWDTCRRDFESDGALRDICVHATTIEDWRSLYGVLRATYRLEYSIDGTQQALPATVDEGLATRSTSSPMICFHVGAAMVICHFFEIHQIEMDIDPREVTSQMTLDDLLGFLRLVGDTLG